ncbi:MAG: hypothetical protein GX154_01665 [Clostridiales bacterium]|nr:hypothetical protein [Clostridiales bacterium]
MNNISFDNEKEPAIFRGGGATIPVNESQGSGARDHHSRGGTTSGWTTPRRKLFIYNVPADSSLFD